MLVCNIQEYVWPHAVVSIKRKLKVIVVNFHHFEFGTLQIQFTKALIEKGCECGKAERTFCCEVNLMTTNWLL